MYLLPTMKCQQFLKAEINDIQYCTTQTVLLHSRQYYKLKFLNIDYIHFKCKSNLIKNYS